MLPNMNKTNVKTSMQTNSFQFAFISKKTVK